MRSRFTSALVALLAVLALGAVAASGASAHEYFIEGKSMKELGLKEETFSQSSSETQMTMSGEGFTLVCQVSVSGVIKAGGTGTARFTLSECRMTKPGNCSVKNPSVVFEANSSLVESEGLQNEFAITESEAVAFHLGEPACEGSTWPLGGFLFGGVSEVESSKVKLTLGGSWFTLGGKPFDVLSSPKVQLSGANAGKKWSAKK